MKYLKYFETEAAYASYKNGSDYVTPNVSYVEETKIVSYNPGSNASSDYVMIDLGLPSGLLWADRNVGASSPEDAGLYFQWGDTVGYTAEQVANGEKKFASDWSDCFDTMDGGDTFNKYTYNGLSRLEASDDAATVNMGLEYRMPTESEMGELYNNTTITFIDLEGNEFTRDECLSANAISRDNLKGIKLTGSNGNSIFIPAAGWVIDSSLRGAFGDGYMWSSDLHDDWNAYYLGFSYYGIYDFAYESRVYGYPVRGVQSK